MSCAIPLVRSCRDSGVPIEQIGNVKLVDLKVRDVQFTLGKLAERLSTRSVRLARMILIQAMETESGPV